VNYSHKIMITQYVENLAITHPPNQSALRVMKG